MKFRPEFAQNLRKCQYFIIFRQYSMQPFQFPSVRFHQYALPTPMDCFTSFAMTAKRTWHGSLRKPLPPKGLGGIPTF